MRSSIFDYWSSTINKLTLTGKSGRATIGNWDTPVRSRVLSIILGVVPVISDVVWIIVCIMWIVIGIVRMLYGWLLSYSS